MKKILSLSLAFILVFCLSDAAFAVPNGKLTEGDALTASDARLILRAAVGLEPLTEAEKLSADLDLDGTVTAADARTALRAAVGLELMSDKYFEDAYAALQNGHFYAVMPMNDDGMTGEMTLAFTENTVYLRAQVSMEGMDLALPILRAGGRTYLFEATNRLYAEMTDEDKATFSSIGLDLDEFFRDAPSFSNMPPLGDASGVTEEAYRGENCACYIFKDGSGTMKVYMKGRQLMGFTEQNAVGKTVADTQFSTFSIAVPADRTQVPAGYTDVGSAADLMFIIMAMAAKKD